MPQPSTNPFTPEQPITEEEHFFGREDVVEWIDDRFVEGQRFILVYGTPRLGKTSLLHRLRPRFAAKAFAPYVDLGSFDQAPMRELLWRLIAEVHRQVGEGHAAPPELSREEYLSQPDYLQQVALPAWRRLLRGKRLVLLLDGLDLRRLQEGAWAELVLRLREVLGQEVDLAAVATIGGSSGQAKEPVPALRGLPAWDLEALTEAQTEELLVGEARYQLGFDYDALRRVHFWTGGYPYLVQAYGAELYKRLAPYGQATIHIVGDLVPAMAEAAGSLFAAAWSELSREAQIALAAIAAVPGYSGTFTPWELVVLMRKAGVNRSPEAMEASLRELCDRRILRWLGGSAYTLRVELWRPWLARAHPLPEMLHGKRKRKPEEKATSRPRLSIDWGALVLWVGIGLGILLVVRMWASRGSGSQQLVPPPTFTPAPATPRPTPTPVMLPGRIAFMAQATAHDPWCIWAMLDDGSDPVRLTDGTSDDTMPAWSPDGKRLAFISNRSGNRDLWLMDADGTHLENITNSPADEWTPAWSPDGTAIAFASYRDGNWEVYVGKPDGSQVKRISYNAAADYAPSWSPDGGRLAFVSERDGNPEIYAVNRDGSGLQRLTKNQVTDLSPRWSPDGKLIAFETYRDGNMEVYTVTPDGSTPRNLSNEAQSDEHGPSWSPDGKRITYYSNRDGSWDIFVMLADGSQKTNLTTSSGMEQGPVWQPRGE